MQATTPDKNRSRQLDVLHSLALKGKLTVQNFGGSKQKRVGGGERGGRASSIKCLVDFSAQLFKFMDRLCKKTAVISCGVIFIIFLLFFFFQPSSDMLCDFSVTPVSLLNTQFNNSGPNPL